MRIKYNGRLLVFLSYLIIFLSILSGGHFEYNKNSPISKIFTYKQNIAQALGTENMGDYGRTQVEMGHTYSVYLDSDYDYEFRPAWVYGAVGRSPRLRVFDLATPYTILDVYYPSSNYDFSCATSGYYNISTYQCVFTLFRQPKSNPFRQYGNVLTPQPGYPTSCSYPYTYQSDVTGDYDTPVYSTITLGLTNLNLGTMKYDPLSRTFTGVINSFSEQGITVVNPNVNFYIVDIQGNRTQIFHQNPAFASSDYYPLTSSRAMTALNVNIPVKLVAEVQSPTPVTIDIPFMDTTPPTIPTFSPQTWGWSNKGSTTVTAYSADDRSVAGYIWCSDGYNWTGVMGNTYTFYNEGAWNLQCKAVDSAGNVSLANTIWQGIDRTPPVVNFSINGNSTYSTSQSTVVNVTDNVSGVNLSTLQYSWSTSTSAPTSGWQIFTNNTTITSPANLMGAYYLYIQASDSAGNSVVTHSNAFNIAQAYTPTLNISNVKTNTMDINLSDSNILPVQYQISTIINGQKYYVTSSGTLSTSLQSITLSNKKITVTGLTPNTTYTFQACSVYYTVTSSLSSPVSGTTLVAVPTGITCIPNNNSVKVDWPIVSGASTYYISNDGINNIGSTSANSYTQTGLSPGTKYNYYIKAGNVSGNSSWSSVVSATTALDIPTNVVATSAQGSITMSWSQVNGATGYDVSVDGNITSTANTTITITGLTAGTKHIYDVRATKGAIVSLWSSEGNKLTNINPPLTPTNLSAVASNSTITLSWNPSATATTYEINADGNILNSDSSTTYEVTGLLPGTAHTYMVRALNSGGKSAWSPSIPSTTKALGPNVPANLTSVTTNSAITISWEAVKNATSYDIETSTTTGSSISVTHINVVNTTYTYSQVGVTTSAAITFRVRSEIGSTPSDWCDSITAMLGSNPTEAPQNATATSTDTSVTLSWDHLSNATSYDIEENGIIVGNVVNSITFTHTGLTPSKQYSYRIRGKNASGTGSWSNYVVIYTNWSTPIGIPGNIIAFPTENSINLVWNTVEGATGYRVYITGVGLVQNVTGIVSITKTVTGNTITLSNLSPNTPYSFKVCATKDGAISSLSGVVTTSTLQLGQAYGSGSASSTVTENVVQNGEFNLLFNTSDIQNLSTSTFTIKYDPSVLTVEDLCATTPLIDLAIGNILGTDLSVTTFDTQSGVIVFKLNTVVSQGQSYSGMITAIKFKSNMNGKSIVKFIADQGGSK